MAFALVVRCITHRKHSIQTIKPIGIRHRYTSKSMLPMDTDIKNYIAK